MNEFFFKLNNSIDDHWDVYYYANGKVFLKTGDTYKIINSIPSDVDPFKKVQAKEWIPCDEHGNLIGEAVQSVAKQEKTSKKESSESVSVDNWTDKHYNCMYKLTPEDIEAGEIKIDAYFVAEHWKLGKKDNSGALFHILKTLARFGDKNPIIREAKAVYNQIKGYARVKRISLD